jgi:GNAT superfamily N-acetyltransferase
MTERKSRAEARREAAPAAVVALAVLVGLALVSWLRDWELVGLPWWIWLLLALPSLLLVIDLLPTLGGAGRVRSRRAALTLLGFLVAGNFAALALLLTALVTASTATLGGGELLLTGFAIWTEQVYVAAAHRGTGVANVLMGEAERRVKANGHRKAWLAVVAGNTRARSFYERAGWVDEGPFDYAADAEGGSIAVPCRRYTKLL